MATKRPAPGRTPIASRSISGSCSRASETTPRDLVFDLPSGFSGNPGAVPDCPREQFDKGEGSCPPESQVGLIGFALLGGQEIELPIFELEPAAGEVIAFGSEPACRSLALRWSCAPTTSASLCGRPISSKLPIVEGHAELWGVPADRQQGTTIPPKPLLTAPTRCGPLSFTFRTRSWQEGAPWLSASTELETPLSGCESLAFRPRFGLHLDNPLADSPTGLRMEMSTPPEEEGSTRADAQIEDVTIELPEGVTLSPAGAEALSACRDTQLGLGSSDPALCPSSSQVGTVEFASPSLPEPLSGIVYLGEERPGERFRLFVVAEGPGIVVKFVGAMQVDPLTGRLSARLGGLPQASIDRLSMSFAGGPGALLATPLSCGPIEASGSFVPYGGGPAVQSSAQVAIEGRPGWLCPGRGPFAPRLLASSTRPEAGRLTSFSTTLLREEGEQLPRRFSIALPPGLSAALGSVEPCPEAMAASAACAAASRIGAVRVKAGSGPGPVVLPGDVYLTAPYRRAPFGLLMQLRAAIGPFDLGKVGFRAQIQVNARNGRVTVFSDPLPTTIEGMAVRFRAIEIDLDRPGFLRNPTACRPVSAEATIEAEGGATAVTASALDLRRCGKLGFRPRFSLALTSRGARSREQSLQVTARPRRGDANLRSLKIALPAPLRFDVSGLDQICSRYDALSGSCPPGSQVGVAMVRTDLLEGPLRGGIYATQPSGKGQPDLWFSLEAMGVRLDLLARASTHEGRLITNLQRLPDMPLSSLAIRLGGKSGAFSLRGGPCRHGLPRRLGFAVQAEGQNGGRRTTRLPVDVKARCR